MKSGDEIILSYQVRVIAHNYNAVKSRGLAIFIKGIQPDMLSVMEHYSNIVPFWGEGFRKKHRDHDISDGTLQ